MRQTIRFRHRAFPVFLLATAIPFARAQDFAVISPTAAKSLATGKDTPAAKAILHNASGELHDEPHPMPRVHTEGTLPHQGIRDQSIAAEQDFDKALNLALAYRLTADKQYLTATGAFLNAWVTVYKVSGNPIDETRWQPMFLAFDLTRGDLAPGIEQQTVAFFRGMALNYLDWFEANAEKDPYNWTSHRIKLAVLSAYETGDVALIDRAARAYRRQVKQNIHSDGEVLDFEKRDALHYVAYDLEPLSMAAIAAKAHGQDWFHTSATGVPSIQQGVDWLIPFATGDKTHEEFAHSSVAFDAARDKAGEKGYSGKWDPSASVGLLAQATWLDPAYAATLVKVVHATDGHVSPWLILLQPAR